MANKIKLAGPAYIVSARSSIGPKGEIGRFIVFENKSLAEKIGKKIFDTNSVNLKKIN